MTGQTAKIWDVIIVGAGPAGLAAAETAAAGGARVLVLEQMPSVGRKFLMAGKSGLNLTFNAPIETFVQFYRGALADQLRASVRAFDPLALRVWAHGLGIETFVGPSGKVFPKEMKASPLLRAWLRHLAAASVDIRTRARLSALKRDEISKIWRCEVEDTPEGEIRAIAARAVVTAMGGGSWPRLGSDGAWRPMLEALGVRAAPFGASNVGWERAWSAVFTERFAGQPLKNIALRAGERQVRGELTVTRYGLEGAPLYTLGPEIAAAHGRCAIDLTPDRTIVQLEAALQRPVGKATVTSWLRKAAKLDPVRIGLLREVGPIGSADALAARIKHLELTLTGKRPIEEAISSSGGVVASALDGAFQARAAPGLYCVGEMADWDAPTGGYLINGCMAMGRIAGAAAARQALDQPL